MALREAELPAGTALIGPIKATHEITGPVQCRQRLGGLLNYYYREAA
jgi:hypothetical protein